MWQQPQPGQPPFPGGPPQQSHPNHQSMSISQPFGQSQPYYGQSSCFPHQPYGQQFSSYPSQGQSTPYPYPPFNPSGFSQFQNPDSLAEEMERIGKWRWVTQKFGESFPSNAVECRSGKRAYVCRMRLGGEWCVGYYDETFRKFLTNHGGKEHTEIFTGKYEILVANPGALNWIPGMNGLYTPNAVPCGKQNGEMIYIGWVEDKGEPKVGSVRQSTGGCTVNNFFGERKYDSYNLLVFNF